MSKSGWRNVKNDPPPAGERVLVAWPWMPVDEPFWAYGSASRIDLGLGLGLGWLDEGGESLRDPSWWQPLPEPPPGGEG